jgi:hypothetical protein
VSDTSASFFVAAKLFVEMSSTSPVYLGSVSSVDCYSLVKAAANLGKQVFHLSKAPIFLTHVTSHKDSLIIVVNARRADSNLAIQLCLLRLPLAGLLQSTVINRIQVPAVESPLYLWKGR